MSAWRVRRRTAPALLCLGLLGACAGTEATSTVPAVPSAAASPTVGPPAGDDRQVITLTYAGGKAGGDTGRVKVPLGATVVLRITSDVADQVHVHGIDAYVDLTPGQQVERQLVADTPGVFEVELHDAGTLLTRLQVS